MAEGIQLPERIRSRITMPLATRCWVWHGAVTSRGYGSVGINGKVVSVHRYVYELAHGPIPSGYQIHHRCGERRCCKPSHLEAVTTRDHSHAHHPVGAPCGRGHRRRQKSDGRWWCPACHSDYARLAKGWRWGWLTKRGVRFKRVLLPPRRRALP